MSTAAEHYAAAESLLRVAEDFPDGHVLADALARRAQVHATLAAVAVAADHASVVVAGSTTVRGIVDMPDMVRRLSFAKGGRA